MVSGVKLQTIHHLSLEGHSFVCMTVIGLKFAQVSSCDTSVQYKSLLSWLAHWDSLWLKGWREINLMKNQDDRKWYDVKRNAEFVCGYLYLSQICFQYTLERYCVCAFVFHYDVVSMSFLSVWYGCYGIVWRCVMQILTQK